MTTLLPDFIITLAIAFFLMFSAALILSYCKRRQNRTQHGLTGMCHQTGGSMCGSCGSRMSGPGPDKVILPRAKKP